MVCVLSDYKSVNPLSVKSWGLDANSRNGADNPI